MGSSLGETRVDYKFVQGPQNFSIQGPQNSHQIGQTKSNKPLSEVKRVKPRLFTKKTSHPHSPPKAIAEPHHSDRRANQWALKSHKPSFDRPQRRSAAGRSCFFLRGDSTPPQKKRKQEDLLLVGCLLCFKDLEAQRGQRTSRFTSCHLRLPAPKMPVRAFRKVGWWMT